MNEGKIYSFAEPRTDGLRLDIHVQPGGSRNELCGQHGDSLKVKVKARPVEGAANQAVREFFAELFEIPKSSVTILKGDRSRTKSILLGGDTEKLLNRLKDVL
jgi:uncharacterized protein